MEQMMRILPKNAGNITSKKGTTGGQEKSSEDPMPSNAESFQTVTTKQPEKLSFPKDLEMHQYPIHEQEGNEQQEPVNVQKQQHEAAEAAEGQEEETANAEAQGHTPDKKVSDANPPEEDNPTDKEGDVDMEAKDEATSEEATPAEPEVEKDRNETMADSLEAADTSGHMAVQQAQDTPEAQDQEEHVDDLERGETLLPPQQPVPQFPRRGRFYRNGMSPKTARISQGHGALRRRSGRRNSSDQSRQ
ncbi:hypothetical protein PI124_g20409 [Phytophthora idaei]|nr:hypothetical protein PI125_g17567 [Phytophthora idaei]KAG3131690.1 hypothetical protein PI126_g19954 [Phytophthora idaei]KAG3234536.1 hypothetical protein PI124_g20409 [Phytophthora idaei]